MDDNLTFYLFLVAPPVAGESLLLFILFHAARVNGGKAGWVRVLWFNVLSLLVLVTLAFGGGELYYRVHL